MKFSLFIHMERLSRDEPQERLYAEMIELCLMADEGGMHAIWTGEHHGMDFTIAPNPFLNLVDLARRTRRVRLGTGNVVAPFWHPIRLAGEAAMTDLLTEGRLELGLARGAYSFEYDRLCPGLDAWTAGQKLRELVPALKGLWEGDYAHAGEHWRFPSTTSAPKPVQRPHPPIWIAARDPNSHDFAVAQGCHVQVTPLHKDDDEVRDLMAKFDAACAKSAALPRPKIMLLRHGYVAADDADADRAAAEINRYYNYFGAWWKNDRPVSQANLEPLTEAEIAAHPVYSAAAMRRNQVIGEAPEVIARLRSYAAMGFDEFSLWIDSGMSFARKRASLERFLRDVMPAFA
jgi:alkanesulfonate monooxygenase SsuD/methylene tetrahydromethanopterin reductase-like flavin-dependent oxidoreductase (luciferase family)